jgi:hypothetical protein
VFVGAAAVRAACIAIVCARVVWPFEPGGGGGGGWDLAGAGGGRGADTGGAGGGGTAGAELGGGGGGAPGIDGAEKEGGPEGLREPGGGGGFLPIGGGGPLPDRKDDDESGLGISGRAFWRRFATEGWKDGVLGVVGKAGRPPGIGGAAPGGGLGADIDGGLGTGRAEDSGSERYDASRFAVTGVSRMSLGSALSGILPPVSTPPPVLRSFGIPPSPANKPAS